MTFLALGFLFLMFMKMMLVHFSFFFWVIFLESVFMFSLILWSMFNKYFMGVLMLMVITILVCEGGLGLSILVAITHTKSVETMFL